MCEIILSSTICKRAQMSNWGSLELSTEQLTYAATDAWIVRDLLLATVHMQGKENICLPLRDFTSSSTIDVNQKAAFFVQNALDHANVDPHHTLRVKAPTSFFSSLVRFCRSHFNPQ